jgi:hypothetical protein
MTTTTKRILKSDNVKLEGQFRLDLAQVESAGDGPKRTSAASAAPQARIVENHPEFAVIELIQARIVENHPEFAVIELICSCGTGTYLRCEYAGVQAPEASQTQNSTLETSNEVPDQAK